MRKQGPNATDNSKRFLSLFFLPFSASFNHAFRIHNGMPRQNPTYLLLPVGKCFSDPLIEYLPSQMSVESSNINSLSF